MKKAGIVAPNGVIAFSSMKPVQNETIAYGVQEMINPAIIFCINNQQYEIIQI